MTRSDILLDSIKVEKLLSKSNITEKSFCLNHMSEMADILDDMWLIMLALQKDSSFSKLGDLMEYDFMKRSRLNES